MKLSESASLTPRVRLTLGACKFAGIFDCPCPEGSAYESIKDIKHDLPCERCGHALSLHRDHQLLDDPLASTSQPQLKTEIQPSNIQLTSPESELNLETAAPALSLVHREPGNTTQAQSLQENILQTCQRRRTVSQITRMLDCESVLIWGMSGSGKTTLAYLLLDSLIKKGQKVVFVAAWPEGSAKKKPEEVLLEQARTGFPSISNSDLLTEDIIFIIDEAQETLKQERAWNSIINRSVGGPRFCFFSSQGMFAESNSKFATMPEISHLITHGNGDGYLSLFFTRSEFEDLLQLNWARYGYLLGGEAAGHIVGLTAGHPSLTALILDYVEIHYKRDTIISRSAPSLTQADVMAILHSDDRLFAFLGDRIYPDPFARVSKVAISVFKKLLCAPEKRIGFKSTFTTMGKCFLNGLICHEVGENDQDYVHFPSPLHARWAQWYHKIEPGVYSGEPTP